MATPEINYGEEWVNTLIQGLRKRVAELEAENKQLKEKLEQKQ